MLNNFAFAGTGWSIPDQSGQSFSTNVTSIQQANDEYITITFHAKDSVDEVSYTKGSLKGLNGVDVESQAVTPILQP